MIKKVLLGLFIALTVISFIVNILLLSIVLPNHINEQNRQQESAYVINTFKTPIYRVPQLANQIKDKVKLQEDLYLQAADSLLYALDRIESELINTSGGVKLSGRFENPHSISYTESYFYKENHFRSNAISYYQQSIINYLKVVDELKIDSTLPRLIELQNKEHQNVWFNKMTVNESVVLINMLSGHVLLDKYDYLLKNK
jgi:hypothetical protein